MVDSDQHESDRLTPLFDPLPPAEETDRTGAFDVPLPADGSSTPSSGSMGSWSQLVRSGCSGRRQHWYPRIIFCCRLDDDSGGAVNFLLAIARRLTPTRGTSPPKSDLAGAV
jgi:hypothetical protein